MGADRPPDLSAEAGRQKVDHSQAHGHQSHPKSAQQGFAPLRAKVAAWDDDILSSLIAASFLHPIPLAPIWEASPQRGTPSADRPSLVCRSVVHRSAVPAIDDRGSTGAVPALQGRMASGGALSRRNGTIRGKTALPISATWSRTAARFRTDLRRSWTHDGGRHCAHGPGRG